MTYHIQKIPLTAQPFFSAELPVHAHPELLSAFATAYHVSVSYLLASKDETNVALMPVFERQMLGIKSMLLPQLCYYNPFHFELPKEMNPNRQLLRKLEITREFATYIKKHYTKVGINLPPSLSDCRGFTWTGLHVQPRYTFLVPLHTIDSSHFFKNERNSIHKAARQGIRIEEHRDFEVFLKLATYTNDKQERLLSLNETDHLVLLDKLYASGLLRQFNAILDNKVIATFLIIPGVSEGIAYAWQHYTDPEYLHTGVSPFFMATLFTMLKEEFNTLDYCGGNHPAISRYKAAFGANLQVFFRVGGYYLKP
jgi:hypothetical protein